MEAEGAQETSQIRVIIQFYYDFLRKKTAAVDLLDENQDTLVLLRAISVKVDRPLHEIVATIKKDNISVRIVAGWPLWFYEIKDKSHVNVEFKDGEADESHRRKSSALNSRYLQKLGFNKEEKILSVIKDFEEEENDDDNNNDQDNNTNSTNNTSFRKFRDTQSQQTLTSQFGSWKNNSQHSVSSSDEDDGSTKNIDLKKILENYLETLIRECKSNHLEEVKKLFSDTPMKIAPQQLSELMVERQKVINELGKDGFNPLHRAVQQKNAQIVQELLNHGANVNVPNIQGWTSVQIAIHKDDLSILKLLLESPTFDIQYVSQIGTALTIACQFSKAQIIPLLLEKNPTFELEPYLELCKSDDCLSLLKTYIRSVQDKKQITIVSDQITTVPIISQPVISLLPPKPPIVRGTFYKMGALLFNIRERYFVLNPDEGTLIRYKQPGHYPLKPLEVIPLKDITVIQEIQKSWFMSSEYSYFEINFPRRQVLACRNNQTVKKWIEYLFMASVYSSYTESRNQFNASQIEDNTVLNLVDSPNQQPCVGQIGGNVRDAVRAFEIQKKNKNNLNNQQQEENRGNSKNSSNNRNTNSSSPQKKSNNLQQQQQQQNGQQQQQQQRSLSPQQNQVQNQQQKQSAIPSKKSTSPPKAVATTAAPVHSSSETGIIFKNSSSENTQKRNSSRDERQQLPQEDAFPDLSNLSDEKVTFESFQIMKVLGAGSFGKVFLAKKKDTSNVYAIKALKKRPLIMKRQLRYAVTEANVLKMCSHPFVLGLHFALQTPNYLYLVLDYCSGGDISSHLAYKRRFKEEETVFYIAELVLAIQYIHEKDVVYRDLKPENILIAGDGHIKLADFGLSKDNVTDQSKTKSFCGTPAYLSPEMLNNKGATKASDLYGIGAVLYEMLTGDPPYYNDDIPTMYKKIKEGNLTFPSYVSSKARNIINGLLDRNPKTRLGASDREQLKRDPFFEKIDWEKLYNKQYTPPITEFENIEQDEEDFEDPSEKNVFNDFDYQSHNQNTNRVKNFSFVRK